VDEAVRNAVAVGADPDRMAGLDNFCWCDPVQSEKNPEGQYKLAQLVRANRSLYQTCVAYGVPCISGKDSMKNDAVIDGKRISIPPTMLYSLVGMLDDAGQAVSMDAKNAGDRVYVLGTTRCEMGASEYYLQVGAENGQVPQVRCEQNLALYRALHQAIWSGCVASCHDLSDGGLGIALAETAFAGDLGMDIDLARVPREDVNRDDYLLYAESQGRFVVTVPEAKTEKFEALLSACATAQVGLVTDRPNFEIKGLDGKILLSESLTDLKQAWQRPLDL